MMLQSMASTVAETMTVANRPVQPSMEGTRELWNCMRESPTGAEINPWTARFSSTELESLYREHTFEADRRISRLGTLIVFTIWAAVAFLDGFSYPDAPLERLFLVRMTPLALALVFQYVVPPKTWAEADRFTVVGLMAYSTSLGSALWMIEAPSLSFVTWSCVTVFASSGWGILPPLPQALVHLYTVSLLSTLALTHPDPATPARAIVAGVASITVALLFHRNAAIRERRLRAQVWRTESEVDARAQLLASVAHELRTPLTATRFAVALGRADPESADEMWDKIDERLQHLASLVDTIIKFGRLDLGVDALPHTPVEVSGLVTEVLDDVSALRTGLSFEGTGTGTLVGDRDLIRAAMTGLASNATRYAKSRVRIAVTASEDTLEIAVEDDGEGVAEPDRERIFEPMVSLNQQRSEGLGMGLAIAMRIAQAHGGGIELDASPLGGARFRIRLPNSPP